LELNFRFKSNDYLEFKCKICRVEVYNWIFILKYSKLKCPFLQSINNFLIEILIFGFENINLEFIYQCIDQISFFENLNWKYHIRIKNLKFK
jgi:hypothetical protein